MQGIFDDDNSMYKRFTSYEEDCEDGEFLKSLYPPQLVDLQLIVEEECDKLEYDGSVMFDEYPDKIRIMGIVDRVQRKASGMKCADRSLMEVLVINEIMRRRIRRRNCRKQGFC